MRSCRCPTRTRWHTCSRSAARTPTAVPRANLCRVGGFPEAGILQDALTDPEFAESLLEAMAQRARYRGGRATVIAHPTSAFARLRGPEGTRLDASLRSVEQSNNSGTFGERLIMKFYRRLEEGINPDLEVSHFLSECGFPNIPPVAGSF